MPSWTTPTDFATSHNVTAAEWNAELGANGNTAYLYGDTAWTAVSVFANAWASFGAPEFAPGYRLIGNRVYLRGCMKSGTIGLAAFTLPSGYRPTATIQMATTSNGAFGSCQISSGGVFNPNVGSNVSYFLDNLSFDTL